MNVNHLAGNESSVQGPAVLRLHSNCLDPMMLGGGGHSCEQTAAADGHHHHIQARDLLTDLVPGASRLRRRSGDGHRRAIVSAPVVGGELLTRSQRFGVLGADQSNVRAKPLQAV